MSRDVVVSFGEGRQYEFRVLDSDLVAITDDQAHRWLDQEWDVLECEAVRPTGKVLLLDKVLGVARGGGERRFAEDGPWARGFARSVARLLDRPVVIVDVAESRVG
jgi:hypothetical protein